MVRKRYSDEDVFNLLRQIELSPASGNSVETACRSAGISDATYYNWRKRYGGMGKLQKLNQRVRISYGKSDIYCSVNGNYATRRVSSRLSLAL